MIKPRKGTEPTPLELRPRFSLGGEDNWMLCLRQLREAGASSKLIEDFSYQYGYESQETNSGILGIGNAAEKCGLTVHWTN